MNNVPVYNTAKSASDYKLQFFFESDGEVSIVKAIEYSIISFIGGVPVFNLGFGDYDEENDTILDDVNSNNGDVYTVFNTVLNTVPDFFSIYPDSVIMVGGSDSHEDFQTLCKKTCKKKCGEICKNAKRRIKIYRHFVDKNYKELCEEYIFFGGGIRHDTNERALGVCIVNEFGVIVDATEEIGILHHDQHGLVIDKRHQPFRTRFEIDIWVVSRFFDSHTL